MSHLNITKDDFIQLGGPTNPVRFDANRLIDLTKFLPSHLKESEVNDFLELTNDFLNTLYNQYITTATSDPCASACSPDKISILEKINRLTELHDPELVDLEYIQNFADYLGYTVDLTKGEIGLDLITSTSATEEQTRQYLRWVVTNLPNWYQIKTTRKSIRVMLYSFGLIGDIIYRYTNDYRPDNGTNWLLSDDSQESIDILPEDFYPTPHFLISLNLDNESNNISFATDKRNHIHTAIDSIRPINTVFDGTVGQLTRNIETDVSIIARENVYIRMSVP